MLHISFSNLHAAQIILKIAYCINHSQNWMTYVKLNSIHFLFITVFRFDNYFFKYPRIPNGPHTRHLFPSPTPISNALPRPDWPVHGLHYPRSNHDLQGVGVGVDQNFLIVCGRCLTRWLRLGTHVYHVLHISWRTVMYCATLSVSP